MACSEPPGNVEMEIFRPSGSSLDFSYINSDPGNIKHPLFLSIDPGLEPVELHLVLVPLEAVETVLEAVGVLTVENCRVTLSK